MLFTLEVLQAYHGDCLILHYGRKKAPRFVVVDGGPAHTYADSLRPRLDGLRDKWRPDRKLSIDLLMVTHVDDDHIQGVLDLMNDLLARKAKKTPQPYQILTLWHNSFEDVLGGVEPAAFAALGAPIGAGVRASGLPLNQRRRVSLGVIAAGIAQGRQLHRDARALNLMPLNSPFNGLVMAQKGSTNLASLGSGLTLKVLHPNKTRIERLQKEWEKAVEKAKKTGKASVLAAAYRDRSVANLSSIVVMAECRKKRVLLTGDARGDDIIEGLTQAGFMKDGTCSVDVLKLPHHGSIRNVDLRFFRTVLARHYVISADGEHDNPDAETLKLLHEARSDDDFALHLTNRTGKKGLGTKITKFLARRDTAGRRYEVNFPPEKGEPILIDLLEKVRY